MNFQIIYWGGYIAFQLWYSEVMIMLLPNKPCSWYIIILKCQWIFPIILFSGFFFLLLISQARLILAFFFRGAIFLGFVFRVNFLIWTRTLSIFLIYRTVYMVLELSVLGHFLNEHFLNIDGISNFHCFNIILMFSILKLSPFINGVRKMSKTLFNTF